MRKATVASLLILCGSTAAIAGAATAALEGAPQNWSANNTEAPAPAPAPEPTPSGNDTAPPNATM